MHPAEKQIRMTIASNPENTLFFIYTMSRDVLVLTFYFGQIRKETATVESIRKGSPEFDFLVFINTINPSAR